MLFFWDDVVYESHKMKSVIEYVVYPTTSLIVAIYDTIYTHKLARMCLNAILRLGKHL